MPWGSLVRAPLRTEVYGPYIAEREALVQAALNAAREQVGVHLSEPLHASIIF